MSHKAGYVNIIGKPNVGKSTLMNEFVGEKISIVTSKAQTTRHRILGIVNGDEFQIVFSDTPGIIKNPAYKMHEVMNQFVNVAFIDADLILYVVDIIKLSLFLSISNLTCVYFQMQLVSTENGFGWTPGVGDGQGGLACCGSWGCKESDTTEQLN